MRLPTEKPSSIGTFGATGLLVLAGIIWGQLSPWWLFASIPLLIAGIGSEAGSRDR